MELFWNVVATIVIEFMLLVMIWVIWMISQLLLTEMF